MKGIKVDRIISVATLLTSLVALYLVLKKPQPVAPPLPVAAAAANAQSFQQKLDQLEQAKAQGQSTEVHLSANEINAAVAQAAGAIPAAALQQQTSGAVSTPAAESAGTTTEGLPLPTGVSAGDQASVKDYSLNFEGDIVKGQFLTQIGGKDVWVTLAGHLGSKDGYATFDPTQFKVGDLNVPVSLVNDALQKKLLEQRDRLKLPDYVNQLTVQNGELVMK
jgi:hypothetical protein